MKHYLILDRKSPHLLLIPFTVESRDLSIGSASSPIAHLAPSGSLSEIQDYAVVVASIYCIFYYLTILAFTVPPAWEGLYPGIWMAFSLASFRHCLGIVSHRSVPRIPHPKLHPSLCYSVFSVCFSFLYDNPHSLIIHLCLSICTHIHIFVMSGSCQILVEQMTQVDVTLNPGLAIYWFS